MSLTSYLTLGRSGLRVSPFCLGGMTFGEDLGWGSSVADSEAIIARYLDEGRNFIDTANAYTKATRRKSLAISSRSGKDVEIASCSHRGKWLRPRRWHTSEVGRR